MRKLFAIAACLLLFDASAFSQTRSALQNLNNSSINANGQGAITGPVLNGVLGALINGMALQQDANTFSINPKLSGCVGVPYSNGTLPLDCSKFLPISPTQAPYSAVCDGTTVDSAAFTTAIAAGSAIMLPPAKNCVVGNLVIGGNQTLDCQGSILTAAPGANWIVKKTGFNSTVGNCLFSDPGLVQMKTAHLTSGGANPGDTVLSVDSSSGFQVNMVATVQLVSGAYWTSKITAVGTGTITIADPIPSTISGTPTVSTSGSGWVDQTECTIKGGVGPPMTGTLSASAGAITAFAPNSPGLYQTAPSSPAAVVCPATGAAFNGAINVTWGGASAGAFVDAAFGSLVSDNSTDGFIRNVTFGIVPVGLELMSTTGASSAGEKINGINVNASVMVGMAKLQAVNNIGVSDVLMFGSAHHASAYGAAGLYIDGDNQTAASGGNKWSVITLGYEVGAVDLNGTLDLFENVVNDTTRNYGFVCIGCNTSTFTSLWDTFSGPLASGSLGSHPRKGVGVYFGNSAVNNTLTSFYSVNNAIDLTMGEDFTSSLWVNNLTWGPSKIFAGHSTGLYPGYTLASFPTLSISSMTSPVYTAPGVTSATQTVSAIVGTQGEITSFWVATSTPPQAASYQALIYLNRFSARSTVTAAAVAAGGTGGTPGACTATVVGGTGTAATVIGTVSGGGALAGALTVTPGTYIFPPAYPAAVTGCGLTGATVNLTMTNYPTGWQAYGSCTWTGIAQGCLYSEPAIAVFPEDQIELVMAVVGGGTFPAGLTFNGFINGL